MSKARTLANLISDNAELADGQISVAEVVGAAPLASPTFTGTASGTFSGPLTGNVVGNLTGDVTGAVTGDITGDLDLTAIAKDISDTAVDIFVYDTRKDSDGGAWRKRTQGTSWYNETLNTATRGSRKEFPAVAVIVAESDTVTIYDGDDPDLPMWMVFNSGGSQNVIASSTYYNLAAVNGVVCFGTLVVNVNFISEYIRGHRDATGALYFNGPYNGNIAERNGNKGWTKTGDKLIVNGTVNDVAMTVLPNAPIDAATGLPVPTIAVATDGGISVIRDDGIVVDITRLLGTSYPKVEITSDGKLFYNAMTGDYWHVIDIPTSDINDGTVYYQKGQSEQYYGGNPAWLGDLQILGGTSGSGIGSSGNQLMLGTTEALHRIESNPDAPSTGMTNFVTSTYNTGWMNGDIKLATLSDTDDTDVTGTELVTNGTFASDVSGWTGETDTTATYDSGRLKVTKTSFSGPYGIVNQTITTVAGKQYLFQADSITGSGPSAFFRFNDGALGAYTETEGTTHRAYFTATSTSTKIAVGVASTAGNAYIFWDNVSVQEAEEDRSVNGNGLQVFGTVTKNPVATGADLVAYSGFSGTNYLEQPYNSDLDFGTGDFCLMGWFKSGVDNGNYQWLLERQAGQLEVFVFSGTGILRVYVGGNAIETGQSVNTGTWNNVCYARRNGVGYMYLNGELKNTTTMANTVNTNNSSPLRLGARNTGTLYPTTGSLALWRISATAPSPEQIKKIYEDEKVLFQENAQATLYGSSDAVTALAYDDTTDLLHVGTSAGRSVFQGLRRVDNTTTAVGAAISASNGLVADE
jgi:hypothetical protein